MTLEQFLITVQNSGLLGRDRLGEAVREVGGPVEPARLASALVKRGLLTSWQAEKLLAGVHKGYFLGKHKLLRLVASGGMSTVYEAEHTLLRRRVALKVLPKSLVGESSYLERFYREARAVARLDHPNIIRGFDVGQDGDHHYFVMEYVEGTSLEELVQGSGPQAIERAVDMIRQAALGLEHAHQAGLVHRDIKPANLLLDVEGTVKLVDLGLVRSLAPDAGEAALTRIHDESVLGTVDYLSPEQAIDSHDVDIRSDIYSLGCTLYFLIAGSPPFAKGTLAERLLSHQTRSPAPLASIRADCPDRLARIVARMMAKRPEDRYQTPEDVAVALGAWLAEGSESRRGRDPSAESLTHAAGLPAPKDRGPARSRRPSCPGKPATSPRVGAKTTAGRSPSSPRSRRTRGLSVPSDAQTTPPLAECWERWAHVFETLEARGYPRLTLGEASYRLIYENLLLACRTAAETAEESDREYYQLIEDLVAPWLTLQALRSILRGDMKGSIVGQFREVDRSMRFRPFLAVHGRLILKVAASGAVLALAWSYLPMASPFPTVSRVSMSLLTDARQVIRKIAYVNDLINGLR